ncbi:MAG: ribose-phosphate pyrophosphokinase [Myxococcales bacterium]|nr:ribose-phosphate pyrophosphokinase [Myxococcales bacterium]
MFRQLKIFSGSSHPELGQAICDHLEIRLGRSELIEFSNENLVFHIEENVRECDVFVIQTATSPVNKGIMELLIMIDAFKHASAARITAVIPYFPYARSDKKDKPRISITARLMADLLEVAGADRVLTMDLHSPQIQGFFHIPVDQLIAAPLICDHIKEHDALENYVLIAADAGEAKGLGRFANRLNLPMAIIDKRRYADDEKAVPTNLIGDVKGKHALIIDDEIATGGTLVEAARFVEKHGALSVMAAATHPVLSGPAVERINNSNLKQIFVTDTIPTRDKQVPKMKVLTVAPMFAEAIKRIHNGDSISQLFR